MSESKHHSKYPPEIIENYEILETLGSGGFAKVKLGRHRLSKIKVAIKIMDKKALLKTDDLKRVALEIKALKDLKHQNICQLYQVVETPDKYYLVLEHAPNGELFDYIVSRGRCKEEEARRFFRQIVSAVAYCHAKGIAHRDLKPENLLLDANNNIKLIDFGLIGRPGDLTKDKLKTCCGSAAYAAPELIRGETYLGIPADVWSLGILLYALLCGFLPFDDENTQRLYQLIQKGRYELPSFLSRESIKFIGFLLKHKPEQRPSLPNVLRHPWMTQGLVGIETIQWQSIYNDDDTLDSAVIRELAKFYGTTIESMEIALREDNYDSLYATYQLMCLRRSQGQRINLPSNRGHLPPDRALTMLMRRSDESLGIGSLESMSLYGGSTLSLENFGKAEHEQEPVMLGDAQRWASMGDTALSSLANTDSTSLGRSAIARTASTPGIAAAVDSSSSSSSSAAAAAAAAAVGGGMGGDRLAVGAYGMGSPLSGASPLSSRKGRVSEDSKSGSRRTLGSLRNLARSMRSVFGGSSRNVDEPPKIKGVFSYDTTSNKEPRQVLAELVRVCHMNGLVIKEKGFLIKAKKVNEQGKEIVKLNFEVGKVQKLNITGIKVHRIKGDTWQYKNVCDEIFSQLKL